MLFWHLRLLLLLPVLVLLLRLCLRLGLLVPVLLLPLLLLEHPLLFALGLALFVPRLESLVGLLTSVCVPSVMLFGVQLVRLDLDCPLRELRIRESR